MARFVESPLVLQPRTASGRSAPTCSPTPVVDSGGRRDRGLKGTISRRDRRGAGRAVRLLSCRCDPSTGCQGIGEWPTFLPTPSAEEVAHGSPSNPAMSFAGSPVVVAVEGAELTVDLEGPSYPADTKLGADRVACTFTVTLRSATTAIDLAEARFRPPRPFRRRTCPDSHPGNVDPTHAESRAGGAGEAADHRAERGGLRTVLSGGFGSSRRLGLRRGNRLKAPQLPRSHPTFKSLQLFILTSSGVPKR